MNLLILNDDLKFKLQRKQIKERKRLSHSNNDERIKLALSHLYFGANF